MKSVSGWISFSPVLKVELTYSDGLNVDERERGRQVRPQGF